MRFKKYIFLSLVLCGFAACSDDNTIEIPETPVLEKAQLALAIKSEEGTTTKAGETSPTDADVNTLTVGVFGTGWNVVYTKDATDSENNTKVVGPQEVYAGAAKVVVVANASEEVKTALQGAASLDDFIATTIKLEEETLTKGLTMSSEVLGVTLIANATNYIGYAEGGTTGEITVDGQTGQEVYGKGPVKLVRDVASIALTAVTVGNPTDANYESVDFSLKEVFIASAKGVSSVASTGYWKSIEKTFDFADAGFGYGNYKVGQSFAANIDEGSYKKGTQAVLQGLSKADEESSSAEGHEFYVYENVLGEVAEADRASANTEYANHTLLIVKGDYIYKPEGAAGNVTKNDCYYAVPVGANVTVEGEEKSGFYVKRNYKYAITLTIIGPGSEIPYDPMISTNVSASVKVEPWNVKTIHEEVE
ncbi:fimbrial protein [Parabacteroides sp.]|uniref:fimbrial protein n=1 Tax=Parabacteroides sp. TaxID=1869337 RepID=UPI0026DECFB1|nr:fimbrial protein [Parabacteroides sp.]MDO5430536.1 fimbrial protein [Parabacteroides sp.]